MEIESTIPRKSYNLSVGDIIFGEDEFINGRYQDLDKNIIEVGFKTEEECEKIVERIETMFSKGKVFQFPIKSSLKNIDYSRSHSIWYIEKVHHIKSFEGLHGTIPEMKLIRARKIVNNEIDKTYPIIEFYTICEKAKNVINKEFEIVGKMTKNDK